jgi:hypothetical protein
LKAVAFHDAGGMIPEARVEGDLALLENLIDSQLVDHLGLAQFLAT